MDDSSVLDAFLDSPAVPLTTKRRLAPVCVLMRNSVNAHFGGELHVVHVHLCDCRLFNVDFLLRTLFPKNRSLCICAHNEKYLPKLNLRAVVGIMQEKENHEWSWHLNDTERRMTYTTAYFLGHLLVIHCLEHRPSVMSTNNVKMLLDGFFDLGQYERCALNGHDADRGILHATMLCAAQTMVRNPDMEDLEYTEGELQLSSMGLNADSICKLAPMIHETILHHEIKSLALDHNYFGLRGSRALFGEKDVEWFHLTHLQLGHTNLGKEGCQPLFDAIQRNAFSDLESLSLRDTELDDEGACMLWRVVPKLRKLVILNLSENLFGPAGLAPLNRRMHGEWLPKLRVLHMDRMQGMEGCNAVKADMALARAVVDGRFPALRTWTLPTTFEGTLLALKAAKRERDFHRAREQATKWLADAATGSAKKKKKAKKAV